MSRAGSSRPIAAALLLAGCVACAAVAAKPPDIPHGTVLKLRIPAPSVGDTARGVRIYLPPSYSKPESADRRYPVVYMLHGWPGSEGNLVEKAHADGTADSLIASGAIPEIIMVFPSGAGAGLLGRSYWIDSYDGKKRVETFVTHDLIDWIDTHYRTHAAREGRGLIGISEGGDAAVNLAFKHPDLFAACGGHSAKYVLDTGFGTHAFLGPEPDAARLLEENSPLLYVRDITDSVRGLRIYVDCGVEDEDAIEHTRQFHHELDSLEVPHEFHEFPGSHTWDYWRRHLRESLLAVAGALD